MKKFIDIILCILVCVSIASYFGADWINKNHENHFALNTWYFGQNPSADNTDSNTQFTFVVNYYANEDNSGAELYELQVNYFTDKNLSNIYSLGVQILNPSELTYKYKEYDERCEGPFSWIGVGDYYYYLHYELEYNDAEVTYFNTDDGVSFVATDTLELREEPYIISIEDKAYAFDFEKESLLSEFNGITNSYRYFTSSFVYFFSNVYYATTGITDGAGSYENLALEINDVFNFYEYNSLTGKFDIALSEFGYDLTYLGIKVNYYTRGAKVHEDSLYNQIGLETGGVKWKNS